MLSRQPAGAAARVPVAACPDTPARVGTSSPSPGKVVVGQLAGLHLPTIPIPSLETPVSPCTHGRSPSPALCLFAPLPRVPCHLLRGASPSRVPSPGALLVSLLFPAYRAHYFTCPAPLPCTALPVCPPCWLPLSCSPSRWPRCPSAAVLLCSACPTSPRIPPLGCPLRSPPEPSSPPWRPDPILPGSFSNQWMVSGPCSGSWWRRRWRSRCASASYRAAPHFPPPPVPPH